ATGDDIESSIAVSGPRGDPIEDLALFLEVVEVWERERQLGRRGSRIRFPQQHQAIWLFERKRSKQHRVHVTEDCSIGADPEGQGNDRNDRETWLGSQDADTIANILKKGFHREPRFKIHYDDSFAKLHNPCGIDNSRKLGVGERDLSPLR